MRGEQEESEEDERISDIANNKHQQADNCIGDEGASALSEALKTNATLTELDLSCVKQQQLQSKNQFKIWNQTQLQTGNRIKDVGMSALRDALMTNTTLTAMNISQ